MRTLRSRLQSIADASRLVYAVEYAKYYSLPDPYRPSANWSQAWPRLAQFIADNHVSNLYAFVALQFAPGDRGLVPTPQQCYGPVALRRWRQHLADAPERRQILQDAFHFNTRRVVEAYNETRWTVADRNWSTTELQRSVLANGSNSLSPMFRHALASQEKFDDLAGLYLEAAMRQYMRSPEDYDAAWPAQWISPELRSLAAGWLCLTEGL